MTINDRLDDAGIDATGRANYLADICDNLDNRLFNKVETQFYEVTPETTDDQYTRVLFSDLFPVSIVNGVATKSDELDIIITDTVTIASGDETTPADIEAFAFAHHGKGILVNNADAAFTMKALVIDRSADNLHPEFVIEMKQLLYHLKIRDPEGVFEILRRLSTLKENVLAENMRTEPKTFKKANIEITPWAM